MTDENAADIEQFSERVSSVDLSKWKYAPEAWRWSRRVNKRTLNLIFRLRSARAIPRSMKARLTAMGIPADIVEETLGNIRSLDQWGNAWIETAQRFLGDYRRQTSSESGFVANEARRVAAMCYHAAQILILDDERTATLCRASTFSLFAQAQPFLFPNAHRVRLPWRTAELPAYYIIPETNGAQTGLVVLLNGASTSKEELFTWSQAFLQRGLAVVAIDSPGTGEAIRVAPYSAEDVDVLDGVFELVSEQPNLDPRQVSVVGISMGGNQAIRALGYDRRILAGVAVTPPYQPARWMNRMSPLLRQHMHSLGGNRDASIEELFSGFDLSTVTPRIRRPVLVYGAGRDLIVPPGEAQLLASRLGRIGTLVWFGDAGHCLYDRVPQWTAEAAEWITAIGNARVGEGGAEPIDDARQLSQIGRDALVQTSPTYEPEPEDDLGDYARLVPQEELRSNPHEHDIT